MSILCSDGLDLKSKLKVFIKIRRVHVACHIKCVIAIRFSAVLQDWHLRYSSAGPSCRESLEFKAAFIISLKQLLIPECSNRHNS